MFATVAIEGETEDDVVRRLSGVAELDHMDLKSHPKLYVCARAGNILDAGFVFMKDEEMDEMAEHYCVDLGPNEPTLDRAEAFAALFPGVHRRQA